MKDLSSSPILLRKRVAVAPSPTAVLSNIGTRLGALTALVVTAAGLVYFLSVAYRAITDAYVAPLILSPDSDLVLDYQQKFLELDMQRGLATAQMEAVDADLSATQAAEKRLNELYEMAAGSLTYTSHVNSTQVDEGNQEIEQLDEQHGLLEQMHRQQEEITKRALENFNAGLVTRGDYEKEVQTLRQNEVALLENNRARSSTEEKKDEALLGQSSLARRSGAMPELLSRNTQMVQVTLELLRIQSENRAKRAERAALKEQIERIESLQKQLQNRPIFKASEKSLYAAFVPYTQLDAMHTDADVYECKFGFFLCRRVGRVAEIVPGEVSAPDPWGAPARGQYILLDLLETKAGTAKVLHIRGARERTAL